MSYCASERKLFMLGKHLRLTGERAAFDPAGLGLMFEPLSRLCWLVNLRSLERCHRAIGQGEQ